MTTHERYVSAAGARRFLVLRHLLAPPRALPGEPASVLRVLDRLGSLQFDPLEIAGRNHDLVLLARIAGYRRTWTDDLLYRERVLYETYNKMLSIVPTAELPWYRITWDRRSASHRTGAFAEHARLVEELLDRIRRDGPLSSTDVEPRAPIDWYWRPTNQVRALLEALAEAGILGISRREGNRRVYDLTQRLFPAPLLAQHPPAESQYRHKLLSRYRAHGLLGATGEYALWAGTGETADRHARRGRLVDEGELVPVRVEGLRGARFVVRSDLATLDVAENEVAVEGARGTGAPGPGRPGGHDPGVVFLAPLDPLAWDRRFLADLFAFDYRWEVYVPSVKRTFGYYVLPLLYGDRFVGRIEPRIERATGVLNVIGLWFEPGFDPLGDANPGFAGELAAALAAHRDFGGLERVALPGTAALRPLVTRLGAMGLLAPPRRPRIVRA